MKVLVKKMVVFLILQKLSLFQPVCFVFKPTGYTSEVAGGLNWEKRKCWHTVKVFVT